MKKIIFCAVIIFSLAFTALAEAKIVRVKSYYKPSTGSFVSSYYKTSPNKTRIDNYSTKYNFNPFTGKKGYVNPYKW